MVQIKGYAILETVNRISGGPAKTLSEKILALLDEETRDVFKGEIYSSRWYSRDFFTRFLELEIRVLADGEEEMVTRGSEAGIARELRGIY